MENIYATRAEIDGKTVTFGAVGPQYTVLQNNEAFDFLKDTFRNGDLQVECAGTTNNGKRSFICAKTEPIKVLDDDIDPYMVFTNSFDGTGSVKVMFTPVRVFCSNCEVLATKKASNKVYIKHTKNVYDNLYIAANILLQNTNYLETYRTEMEELATMRLTRMKFAENLVMALLKHLGMLNEDGTAKEKKRDANLVERYRDELIACWSKADLGNYGNTAYAAFQAISDWETHYSPARNTGNNEIYFNRALNGMVLTNWCLNYIKQNMYCSKI